ncbi:hypothetical protein Tco_0744127 [Tanacetum coccineum]
MEEINNFHQEPNENLYQAWDQFKELLMKCPQHYLTEMQEVILFYNGLGIPTRQILDSRGAIPSKTVADAKVAIQEMVEYSSAVQMEKLILLWVATPAALKLNTVNSTTVNNLSACCCHMFFLCKINQTITIILTMSRENKFNPDDLEEMDLRCQTAMLTMRAWRFLKKTRRMFSVNGIQGTMKTRNRKCKEEECLSGGTSTSRSL